LAIERHEQEDAPGLKWRAREGGRKVPYWVARADIVARGFKPKTVRLHYDHSDMAAIAHRCRVLQAEMLEWSKLGTAPPKAPTEETVGLLIDRYQSEPFSSYHGVKWNTRREYDRDCAKIRKAVGKRLLSALTFADIHRWYEMARRPTEPGKPEQIRAAHGMMTMLRMLFKFGTIAEIAHCKRLLSIMTEAQFEVPKPRTATLSLDQVNSVIAKAHELGAHSIALGQALQYEGMFRQSDVTGQWQPDGTDGGIRLNGRRWTDGLTWSALNPDGIISYETTKTGQRVEVDTALYPLLQAEIARVPSERRIGPMIVDERSGLPYSEKEYGKRWRRIATTAGIPKTVWNRDSRASGITEGRDAGAAIADVSKQAAHSDISVTAKIYDRGELEAARRVAGARSEHRKRMGNG
jgi:integrase